MTTEQKHVLVIRWQLPNWEKISPALLPMTFHGHGKLLQYNIVGKRPAQNYDNAIYNMDIWFSRSCKKYFVCIPMACSFLNKSYTVYETYLCSDVSSVAARHHFPVRSEYLLATKHYSDWVWTDQKNAGAGFPLLLSALVSLAIQRSRKKSRKIFVNF